MSQNAKTERQKWKKRLRAWGMDEAEVALCIEQVRSRQVAKAAGKLPPDAPLCTRAEYVRLLRRQPGVRQSNATVLQIGDDFVTPDDKGYKPTAHDPLLSGVGRATGATARAVKAGKTITKHQHGAANGSSAEPTP